MCIISRLEKFISEYGKFRVSSVKREQRKHSLIFDKGKDVEKIDRLYSVIEENLQEKAIQNGGEGGKRSKRK